MDDPVHEIEGVIRALTQSDPHTQRAAIRTYFTPSASFTHPFCATGSFVLGRYNSRWLIECIFRWYKIMSPHIDMKVQSVAYDQASLRLYVTMSQVFAIFLVPLYRAPVTLTTVLELTHDTADDPADTTTITTAPRRQGDDSRKFYIKSQNDLYQVDQFVRFFLPWGIGVVIVAAWHVVATFFCVLGAVVGWPVTWAEQAWNDRGGQRGGGSGNEGRGDLSDVAWRTGVDVKNAGVRGLNDTVDVVARRMGEVRDAVVGQRDSRALVNGETQAPTTNGTR